MTFSEQFHLDLSNQLEKEGLPLINEFFITFSRFEFALKASDFSTGNKDRVNPDWDRFIASIRSEFDSNKNSLLREASDYIIQQPPKIQTLNTGQVVWKDREFQSNEPEVCKLSQSIRDIRNNLFHGGKFNGNYQADISRNFILLKSSMIILNEWLNLNEQARASFLQPIA